MGFIFKSHRFFFIRVKLNMASTTVHNSTVHLILDFCFILFFISFLLMADVQDMLSSIACVLCT